MQEVQNIIVDMFFVISNRDEFETKLNLLSLQINSVKSKTLGYSFLQMVMNYGNFTPKIRQMGFTGFWPSFVRKANGFFFR